MAPASHRPARILIVDDDPDVRLVLRRMLESGGYDIGEAGHGKEALDSAGERPCDLLITDLIMPGGVSGLDLCEIARTRWPHIRLLLTSGYAEELTNPERFERLKLKLLRKPYRQAELAEAIEAIMSA